MNLPITRSALPRVHLLHQRLQWRQGRRKFFITSLTCYCDQSGSPQSRPPSRTRPACHHALTTTLAHTLTKKFIVSRINAFSHASISKYLRMARLSQILGQRSGFRRQLKCWFSPGCERSMRVLWGHEQVYISLISLLFFWSWLWRWFWRWTSMNRQCPF